MKSKQHLQLVQRAKETRLQINSKQKQNLLLKAFSLKPSQQNLNLEM
jgi:hypothetical protein